MRISSGPLSFVWLVRNEQASIRISRSAGPTPPTRRTEVSSGVLGQDGSGPSAMLHQQTGSSHEQIPARQRFTAVFRQSCLHTAGNYSSAKSTKAFDLDQSLAGGDVIPHSMLRRWKARSAIVPRTDFIEGGRTRQRRQMSPGRLDFGQERTSRLPDRVRCRFRTAGILAGASGASIRCPASKGARAGTS